MEARRVVAVKRYDPRVRRDVRFVAHFRREARQARALRHPHVHRTLSYGYCDDGYYLVTPYAPAGNLERYMTGGREGTVLSEVVRIFEDVCDGLGYIHERGLLHRNLKPTNVLLHSDGRAAIADVGPLYQVGGSDLTMTVATLGTITYFSPEQIMSGALSPASDIYAAGVMLYQACVGRLPFSAASPLALARSHLNDAPPAPRAFNPDLSPALDAVILRSLEKDPARRFSTARDLGLALAACPEAPHSEAPPIALATRHPDAPSVRLATPTDLSAGQGAGCRTDETERMRASRDLGEGSLARAEASKASNAPGVPARLARLIAWSVRLLRALGRDLRVAAAEEIP